MAHEKERQMYADDEKWMAEPWTAWQYKYGSSEDEWITLKSNAVFYNDRVYRRRPDAPKKCCRLCKHKTELSTCGLMTGIRCVCDDCLNQQHSGEDFPSWCPLDAEAKQNDQDIIDRSGCKGCEFAGVKYGRVCCNDPEEFIDRSTGELCCRKHINAEPKEQCDRCSTCRHEYEKKRTIRIEAELPEPVGVHRSIPRKYHGMADLIIHLENDDDEKAWYDAIIKAMGKE